ncbi:FtsW/RodA/SpoVE family cell cycle protein [Paenibacillus eucommiae]|uniref:Rod shape determining protein RodA n=1 Tax=Paenibacillus eucommiae TaxID=1355755 RepID=A0ABS4J7T6_9BACL|nr:FtsW/RodA/SpoVE family cell cycle protein [Paenibacillus eucommiae]MBP1995914.1 rod shape determining protein RodA [Paenibacillus eucommiae]
MFTKLKKIDIPIVVILVLFMGMSTMLVHSASIDHPKISISISKNLLTYLVGFVAFIVISMIDFRVWIKIAIYLYGLGIVLLVAVYLFAEATNGAKGWFPLPAGFSFQPAELVKYILIIALTAWFIRRRGDTLQLGTDLIPAVFIVLIPFVLVVIQPDLGNAVIFLGILVGMIWIGNIKYSHFLLGLVLVVGGGYLLLQLYLHNHEPIYAFLKDLGVGHWANRLDTFLFPDEASKDHKFQVENSMRAIGSGGLAGEGFLKGSLVHRNFIPFAYSDSIFVVVGEEFGFRGAAVLLLIYFILIYRMIQISIQSVHISGSYIVVGVVSMFVFQVFENVGMLIGLMPLTGITLPFISYGGTSLLINMISLGTVMSVKLHQDADPFEIK